MVHLDLEGSHREQTEAKVSPTLLLLYIGTRLDSFTPQRNAYWRAERGKRVSFYEEKPYGAELVRYG